MTENLQERIQLRITPTMKGVIEQIAVERGITWQHCVREALAEYAAKFVCNFNDYCTVDVITGERENFHAWLTQKGENGKVYNLSFWRFLFGLYEGSRDAADLAATQRRALR